LPEWHDSLSLNFYRNGETGNLHVGTAHPVKCVCGGAHSDEVGRGFRAKAAACTD
jgi:hypothetical protein